jgi:hypothetical protein
MEDNYEKYAIAVIIVFGALIIGGLMAASIAAADQSGFLFALGAATAAWIAGHAMLFDRPGIYGLLVVLAALLAAGSTIVLAF